MALTISQLSNLGFVPTKKSSPFRKKYDTLIYPLNKTDYLYLGFDTIKKEINNKIVWKSFLQPDTNERLTYIVINIGSTGYKEMKDFLKRSVINSNYKPSIKEQEYLDGKDN